MLTARNLSSILVILLVLAPLSLGQSAAGDVLATATGMKFTASDLSETARASYENRGKTIAAARERIFSTYLADLLLEMEAKAANKTVAELQDQQLKAVADPPDDRIRAVYEANRGALGNAPLADVRSQIVAFLRREPEKKALQTHIESLQKKYGLVFGTNVNAPARQAGDVVAKIGPRSITQREFEQAARIELHDAEAHLFVEIRDDLENAILAALTIEEAKIRNTEPSTVLAAEITNKMRDYSDGEREELEYGFRRKLFDKFKVEFLLDGPAPLVLDVSVDDDPFTGPVDAPVTVIMFTDLQCPACAGTHPVLKRAIAKYPGKVRLVVRDYPLESIHENAFEAAVAANAAREQGKYFEYIETLYENQNELHPAALRNYASDLGLDIAKFEKAVASEANAAEVRKDVADGRSLRINGTPTIYVNGVKVYHLSANAIREAIDRVLDN
jgi:protein-disulfide isomerase